MMRQTIRNVGLLTAVLAVVLAVAALTGGCSRPSAETPAAGSSLAPGPVELRVLAAASLQEVLKEIAPAFESANGAKLVFSFGASGQLQKQIEAGAPVDVFCSASPKQMDALITAGLVSAEESLTFAGNDLVVFVPVGNPANISGPLDFDRAERLVTGNPETAPFGTSAKEWLEARGSWEALQSRFVFAENLPQALDYVARGEVDAGIGFRNAAAGRSDVEVVYTVPADAIKPIRYFAAPVSSAEQPEFAAEFVAYLLSEDVQAVFGDAGFNPAPAP